MEVTRFADGAKQRKYARNIGTHILIQLVDGWMSVGWMYRKTINENYIILYKYRELERDDQ